MKRFLIAILESVSPLGKKSKAANLAGKNKFCPSMEKLETRDTPSLTLNSLFGYGLSSSANFNNYGSYGSLGNYGSYGSAYGSYGSAYGSYGSGYGSYGGSPYNTGSNLFQTVLNSGMGNSWEQSIMNQGNFSQPFNVLVSHSGSTTNPFNPNHTALFSQLEGPALGSGYYGTYGTTPVSVQGFNAAEYIANYAPFDIGY